MTQDIINHAAVAELVEAAVPCLARIKAAVPEMADEEILTLETFTNVAMRAIDKVNPSALVKIAHSFAAPWTMKAHVAQIARETLPVITAVERRLAGRCADDLMRYRAFVNLTLRLFNRMNPRSVVDAANTEEISIRLRQVDDAVCPSAERGSALPAGWATRPAALTPLATIGVTE